MGVAPSSSLPPLPALGVTTGMSLRENLIVDNSIILSLINLFISAPPAELAENFSNFFIFEIGTSGEEESYVVLHSTPC